MKAKQSILIARDMAMSESVSSRLLDEAWPSPPPIMAASCFSNCGMSFPEDSAVASKMRCES